MRTHLAFLKKAQSDHNSNSAEPKTYIQYRTDVIDSSKNNQSER